MRNVALFASREISPPSGGRLLDGLTGTLSSNLHDQSLGLTIRAACLPDRRVFQPVHCFVYGTEHGTAASMPRNPAWSSSP
jgi:hypothetical protein